LSARSSTAAGSYTLSHPSWQTITLSFATAAGSATAGTDFEATSGTLTFEPGETTKVITVTVYGDTDVEAPPSLPGEPPQGEYFAVNLSGVSNATLVDPQGLGLIVDDD
jgi:chitinase